jgi:hypothetical protein
MMIKAQFGLIIAIAFCSCAIAQEVKNEIWPELNIYYKRHEVQRFDELPIHSAVW